MSAYSRVDRACAACDKPVTVKRCHAEKFERSFCNRQCAGNYRRAQGQVTRNCVTCSTPITRKGSSFAEISVCSTECWAMYLTNLPEAKIVVQCSECGVDLERFPSTTKNRSNFFCNRDCRRKFIIGPNNPWYRFGNGRRREYAYNWKGQRTRAIARDNGVCRECCAPATDVHHVVPAVTFGGDYEQANALDNLISYCEPCHYRVEAETRRTRREQAA